MDKLEIVNEYFGFNNIKKEQEEVIDQVLSGVDTIALLPTGYGKSLTFVVSAMMLEGITIVITPLISLMQDQVNNLKKKGIKAEYINSLMDEYMINDVYLKIKNGKIKILFIAGERLESRLFLNNIKNIKISLIVFDEAHTLLWSEDFRKSLSNAPKFIKTLGYRPKMLALTATATKETVERISLIAGLINPKVILIECDRKNIYYDVIKTNNKNKELIKYINKNKNVKGIIYCLTIRTVEEVYNTLKCIGFNVTLYHGGLDSDIKIKNQNDFSNGTKNIIVSTNAFGMGIDIPDIRYVIEYDMPQSIEDFSQQTGRASRDNKYAEAIILFDKKDIETINYFIDNITNDDKKEENRIKNDRYKKLDKMVSLCLSYKCIHQQILNYFGFESNKCNNMCYICNKKK